MIVSNQKMGRYRSQPDLKKHTKYNRATDFQYVSTKMCGWRSYMQDTHITKSPLTDKKNSLFAVLDGHGGARISQFVERNFVRQLQANLNYKKEDYEVALRETFLRMDELIFSQAGKQQIVSIRKQMRQNNNGLKPQQKLNAGCIANVILITPEFIYCANAGDSRSIASIDGKMQQLSWDHKPSNPSQIKGIIQAGDLIWRGRFIGRLSNLNYTRSIGDEKYKNNKSLPAEQQIITANPDIIKIKNENVDFIIMGCNGIWEIKTSQKMIKWMQNKLEKRNFEFICEDLIDEIVSKDSDSHYGKDSMTAILIKFHKKSQDQIVTIIDKSCQPTEIQDPIENQMYTMKFRSLFLFLFLLFCLGLLLLLGNKDINQYKQNFFKRSSSKKSEQIFEEE